MKVCAIATCVSCMRLVCVCVCVLLSIERSCHGIGRYIMLRLVVAQTMASYGWHTDTLIYYMHAALGRADRHNAIGWVQPLAAIPLWYVVSSIDDTLSVCERFISVQWIDCRRCAAASKVVRAGLPSADRFAMKRWIACFLLAASRMHNVWNCDRFARHENSEWNQMIELGSWQTANACVSLKETMVRTWIWSRTSAIVPMRGLSRFYSCVDCKSN